LCALEDAGGGARLHHDHRDVVRNDVMQLACDPAALDRHRRLGL
jgi:hypothetical protein